MGVHITKDKKDRCFKYRYDNDKTTDKEVKNTISNKNNDTEINGTFNNPANNLTKNENSIFMVLHPMKDGREYSDDCNDLTEEDIYLHNRYEEMLKYAFEEELLEAERLRIERVKESKKNKKKKYRDMEKLLKKLNYLGDLNMTMDDFRYTGYPPEPMNLDELENVVYINTLQDVEYPKNTNNSHSIEDVCCDYFQSDKHKNDKYKGHSWIVNYDNSKEDEDVIPAKIR